MFHANQPLEQANGGRKGFPTFESNVKIHEQIHVIFNFSRFGYGAQPLSVAFHKKVIESFQMLCGILDHHVFC